MEDKQNDIPDKYARTANANRSIFDSKEHRREELEYEEYYNRIRLLSRGMDLT
jgi:hypothetical protein